MDERKAPVAPEERCERLGDLAAQALPAEVCAADAREWARLQDRLDSRLRRTFAGRWWPAFALTAAVLVGVGAWFVARRPLGYRLDGCVAAADGSLTTGAKQGGVVAFEDGSIISLESDARFRLHRPGRGAELVLDRGSASLAVVHRVGVRWAVSAGPFRIDVTGTRFDVAWSAEKDRLKVKLHEGEVRISGGMLTRPVYLGRGQTLESGVSRGNVTITDGRQVPSEPRRSSHALAQPAPAGQPVEPVPAPVPAPATAPSHPETHLHAQAHRRLLARIDTEPSHREPSPSEDPTLGEAGEHPPREAPQIEPVATEPLSPPPLASTQRPVAPAHAAPPPPAPAKPASGRVVFRADGQLEGAIRGFAWVAGGTGAVFTSPSTEADRAHLRPVGGQFCTSGRMASVICVNEHMPSMRCNWGHNWGVSIGWRVRNDEDAWGDAAAGAIAVEFHGRSSIYRLIAHRRGEPDNKFYCIENYRSGRVVTPSMFRSECWADPGEALPDFKEVDYFNLQYPSSREYVAFRYCLSGITFYP